MVSRVNVRDPNEFYQHLDEASKITDQNIYLLFTATKNPSTGLSWCPDCVVSAPIIDKALSRFTKKATILICDVEREPYRNSNYPYRIDPRINLRCVPTLIKWDNGKATLRLNDAQCQNPAAVDELFES